jgi:glutamyl-tRNA synthetase
LVRQGSAYRCFCSRETLDSIRAAATAGGAAPVYDGRCRKLDPADSERRAEAGEACVIRLRMPDDGDIGWTDLVRGELRFKHSVLDDFVLVKSDRNPTYNFAVVVDDVKMRISHVIRGDDHISNTPRQLVLFDALGLPRPEFGHLPMIVGADKARLSKRHGATSVTAFRDLGILPQAMLNYLALLGWAFDGEREIFSPAELVGHFDLKNVSRNPAVLRHAEARMG